MDDEHRERIKALEEFKNMSRLQKINVKEGMKRGSMVTGIIFGALGFFCGFIEGGKTHFILGLLYSLLGGAIGYGVVQLFRIVNTWTLEGFIEDEDNK